MSKSRIHIVISGHVQGVFFRAHTRDIARKLNLNGWVKNRPDGKVEAVIEGDEGDVNALLGWCHDGPPAASVSGIDEAREDFKGEFKGFEILY